MGVSEIRTEDRLVGLLSHWLARHIDSARLRDELRGVDADGLSGAQAEAVGELAAELERTEARGELEMVVRETLEALALG